MQFDTSRIVRGNYMIYKFTNQIYKVVKFKYTEIPLRLHDDSDSQNHYSEKLDNSVSRTRRLILEKALCNPWEWFCTLTLDKAKYDRFNLPVYYKDLSQWLRDQRKKGFDVKYLLVPELHQDGAWHIHGFFYGLPELVSFCDLRKRGHKIPDYLVYSDFYNWPDYSKKFGFCSLGKIRSPVRSAFYISKYITKDHNNLVSDLGAKMFYSSQGLNTPTVQAEIYGNSSELDSYLQKEYDFCSVGMSKVSEGLDWTFALDQEIPFESLVPLFDNQEKISVSFSDDLYAINVEAEQLSFITEARG